jgi:hypothetical protein
MNLWVDSVLNKSFFLSPPLKYDMVLHYQPTPNYNNYYCEYQHRNPNFFGNKMSVSHPILSSSDYAGLTQSCDGNNIFLSQLSTSSISSKVKMFLCFFHHNLTPPIYKETKIATKIAINFVNNCIIRLCGWKCVYG